MLNNSPQLRILKIKVDCQNIAFKIDFLSENLKNLCVLVMDLPLRISCAKIHEQIPFKNHIVSLQFMGKNALAMEKLDFFKKFPYLTKYINGVQKQPHLSNCARVRSVFVMKARSVFVMKAWNLKRNLRNFFRKDIIKEIFLKIY